MEAKALQAIDPSHLRSCGLSERKVQYIRGIAERVAGGILDLEDLRKLSDQELIRTLTACPGIGPWTAEMLLLFSYRRPDIVSWNDLGIRHGLMRLYGLEGLTKEQFQMYCRRYSPCGSTASLYLWAIANEGKRTAESKERERA
jgi:DNA-3-methyladenine glycosylase II